MIKLFYSAGSCSTSCHISLEESGLKYEAIEIDWDNESDPHIAEVNRLNPMGTLPIAQIDGEKLLTQNAAIHTYIADQVPDRKLIPKVGTFERAEVMNWLSFVSSDFHKSFSPLFALQSFEETTREEIRKWAFNNVNLCLAYLDQNLAGKDYLTGKTFTVADAYCFVVSGWTRWLKVPTDNYKNLQSYLARVYQRPAVQKVLKEEGLLE